MLAKAPSLAADEVVVDLEDAVAADGKEHARELAVAALRPRPARPDDRASRQRALDAVVGGRSARCRGGAPRRGRTPQGRVPGGRVRCGRAASGRNRPRGSDRDGARARGGRADSRRRARTGGARLRPGRHGRLARSSRPDDRSRQLGLRAQTRRRGRACVRAPGGRRPARASRRRPRSRPLGATRARARLRRQVGDPPQPDRAGQPHLHRRLRPIWNARSGSSRPRRERLASRASSSTKPLDGSQNRSSAAPSCSPSRFPPFHLRRGQHSAVPDVEQRGDRNRGKSEDPANDACHRAAEGTSEG